MHRIQPEILALTIPIVLIVFGTAIPIFLGFFKYLRRKHLFALYHEERMAAIAKGVEVPSLPDELLHDRQASLPTHPGRALLKGLIWLFIGVGIFLGLRQEAREEAVFAAIPVGIGMAYLIYYFIEGRRTSTNFSTPSGPEPPPVPVTLG